MEIISAWELYLWTRLDGLGILFAAAGVVSGLIFAALMCSKHLDGHSPVVWIMATSGAIFVVSVVGAVLCPSQKDMAMIYVIPKIANSEHIQQEASEVYTMAKDALKEYLPAKEAQK